MRKKFGQILKKGELPPKAGWAILGGTTLLFFLLCRIPLFFLPEGENLKLLLGFAVYLAVFLYSIFYGMFAWRTTGKVLLPALLLTGFATLLFFSEPSGTLDKIEQILRPPGHLFALWTYFLQSLRFGIVAAAVGGLIKNLKG